MQNLSVISVNIWQILISMVNLLILTWIIKRFLYKPVKKMVDARRAAIDEDYARAKTAREEAEDHRRNYETAMAAAKPATLGKRSLPAKLAKGMPSCRSGH